MVDDDGLQEGIDAGRADDPAGSSVRQAPPPQSPPPAAGKPPSIAGIALALLLGLVVGLLVCGGTMYYLVLSGQMDSYIAVAPPTAVEPSWTTTLQPSATPTISATPQLAAKGSLGTLTPTSTITRIPLDDPVMLQYLIEQGGCAEAILILDRMISARPDDGESYIKRAKCYLELSPHLRSQSEYVDYVSRALADADKAIALGTASPDYYVTRSDVYWNLANLSEFREDSDRLLSIGEENVRIAIAMGKRPDETGLGTFTLWLGRCDEFLENEKSDIVRKGQKIDAPDAFGSTALGRGYVCKGELDKALKYVDSGIKQEESSYRRWTRAIILHNMGRLEDALAQLNELVKASPYGGGHRYYLRALVYYDLNKPDLARQDVAFGTGQTWGRFGLRSYVLGKLALDAGDRATGIDQLRLAEATLGREMGPLLDRIRRELKEMGVQPLAPTPSIRLGRTPIPTPTVTLTPRPTVVTSKNFTPPSLLSLPLDYATGTGKIMVKNGTSRQYRLQPPATLSYTSVQFLTFHIIGAQPADTANTVLGLWRPSDGAVDQINIKPGDNPIANPERYVTREGEIYFMFFNSGDSYTVDNAGFTLSVLQNDGKPAVYGLKQQ